MKLIMIRHEQVNMSWDKKYNSTTYDLACKKYDECPIVLPGKEYPKLDSIKTVYISKLPRTYETACRLFKKRNFFKTALLNEVPLKSFTDTNLSDAFTGADTMILISIPFVGPKRRATQKTALDAAVKAGVRRLVYTSIVGAGEKDIDTYEVNDHVWFEAYVKEQPIHYLFLRDSQYAEAMVSNYVNAYENTNNVLANNMGDGKMAYISRDDCALAAACAAMSDWEDRVIDVNGAEYLTIGEYIAIANEVTGHNVK